MTPPDEPLGELLVRWMADNRPLLDRMMAEEGSRAIHEEFLLAESGTLPDRATRIERARGASARAWMRHLAHALVESWPGADAGMPERIRVWAGAHAERLEAHVLQERAIIERRGASGDPHADDREAELFGHAHAFAEALAAEAPGLAGAAESPPEFARRVATWSRENRALLSAVEAEARAAWSAAPAPGSDQAMSAATSAPEPDAMRVHEAAAVWAHVRLLANALGATLVTEPG